MPAANQPGYRRQSMRPDLRESHRPSPREPGVPRPPAAAPHRRRTRVRRMQSVHGSGARAPRRTPRRPSADVVRPSRLWSPELAKQPELRQTPVPFHGAGGHIEHLRGLFHAQTAKESQFDDATLAAIDGGHGFQCAIKRQKVYIRFGQRDEGLVKRDMLDTTSTLSISAGA